MIDLKPLQLSEKIPAELKAKGAAQAGSEAAMRWQCKTKDGVSSPGLQGPALVLPGCREAPFLLEKSAKEERGLM